VKAVHWVQVGLGAVVAACQALAQSVPQWAPTLHVVTLVAGTVLTVLGVVSKGAAQ